MMGSAECAHLHDSWPRQGDLIPWTVGQQFQDADFPALSGGRIVRIAVHPELGRAGYGSRALELLQRYYEVPPSGRCAGCSGTASHPQPAAVARLCHIQASWVHRSMGKDDHAGACCVASAEHGCTTPVHLAPRRAAPDALGEAAAMLLGRAKAARSGWEAGAALPCSV
jgi:hypothetical protein